MLGGGDQQQLVDQTLEPATLVEGHVEQLRALRGRHTAVQPVERVYRAEHDGERRAQLVRDRGNEVVLLAVEVDLQRQRHRELLVHHRARDDERRVVRERSDRLNPAARAGVGRAVAEHDQHHPARLLVHRRNRERAARPRGHALDLG